MSFSLQCAYAVLSFYLLMPFVFMSLFTSDKRFFAADTTARLYHPLQYYLAKITVTLPFNMLVAVVFHLIYYGMIGMRHGSLYMFQSTIISLLLGLTAMQVRGRMGKFGKLDQHRDLCALNQLERRLTRMISKECVEYFSTGRQQVQGGQQAARERDGAQGLCCG